MSEQDPIDPNTADDDDDSVSTPPMAPIRLITSDRSWIEGAAVSQLETGAKLPGMELAVGFPDLHPGKGFPIGAAFVSRDLIYPLLAGNDIGCAMSFWRTDLPARKLKLDRWAKNIEGLDRPYDGDTDYLAERYGFTPSIYDKGLGTIGGGNHFAELQTVEEVRDEAAFSALDLDKSRAALLIHSGSRGLGQAIFAELLERRGANPIATGSEDAVHYMAQHTHAFRWAQANRELIAARFAEQLGTAATKVSDVSHNTIQREAWRGAPAWIHRKGAASSKEGPLMIPGSRGTFSYLVEPIGDKDAKDAAAASLAHGAGRRWQRGFAKSRLSHKYRSKDMERTKLGGRVICEDRELLYDEAPQAYKDVGQVIADLESAGLIKVIALYRPVLTYKVRRRDGD